MVVYGRQQPAVQGALESSIMDVAGSHCCLLVVSSVDVALLLDCVQVQRNWMYLENIFVGSEDIRKQLPQESLMFDGVNQVFAQSMAQLHAVGNVIQATNAPGVLTTFQVCTAAALYTAWGRPQPG